LATDYIIPDLVVQRCRQMPPGNSADSPADHRWHHLLTCSHWQNMTSATNVTPHKNILKSLQFSTYQAHKIFVSVVIVAW